MRSAQTVLLLFVLFVLFVLFEAVERWIPNNFPRFCDIMVEGTRPVPVSSYTGVRLVRLCLIICPTPSRNDKVGSQKQGLTEALNGD